MAKRGASGARRIELNRAWFTAADLAMADGLFEMAKEVVLDARVPDAAPFGQGLIQGGGVLAYVGTKRVAVAARSGGTSVSKPRGSARLKDGVIAVYGGFGFPGRFLEEGTVDTRAQPFLTPELMARLPDAHDYIRAAAIKRAVAKAHRP